MCRDSPTGYHCWHPHRGDSILEQLAEKYQKCCFCGEVRDKPSRDKHGRHLDDPVILYEN